MLPHPEPIDPSDLEPVDDDVTAPMQENRWSLLAVDLDPHGIGPWMVELPPVQRWVGPVLRS